jgi:hypothetical protein
MLTAQQLNFTRPDGRPWASAADDAWVLVWPSGDIQPISPRLAQALEAAPDISTIRVVADNTILIVVADEGDGYDD